MRNSEVQKTKLLSLGLSVFAGRRFSNSYYLTISDYRTTLGTRLEASESLSVCAVTPFAWLRLLGN
jgi:hypothetical protein